MAEVNGIKVPFVPLVQNEDFALGKVKGNGRSFDWAGFYFG